MEKNISYISKEFIEFYASLEELLNKACIKAKADNNADMLQKITDLYDTAKFISTDFIEFDNILRDISTYVIPDTESEDEELK